ncbi:MAG: hypothetical protein AB7T27_06160 [Kiritimatiellia bacterium]
MRYVFIGGLLLLTSIACLAGDFDAALLVAFDEDVKELSGLLNEVGTPMVFSQRTFHRLMAYPQKFLAVVSRAGLQESCSTADAALMKFKADRIISIGVAGSLSEKYKQGDIIVVRRVGRHDRGTYSGLCNFTAKDDQLTPLQWDSWLDNFHKRLKILAEERGITIHEDVLISGNSFISSEEKRQQLATRFKADLVDMNSAGILESTQSMGAPCYIIRVVSDYANETAGDDFKKFIENRVNNLTPLIALVADALKNPLVGE